MRHKPWQDIKTALPNIHGHLGVFEIGDREGESLYIGYAGGNSAFGLRGEIQKALSRMPRACQIRVEITASYLSRYRELLMLHKAYHGELPPENPNIPLGRLSPIL